MGLRCGLKLAMGVSLGHGASQPLLVPGFDPLGRCYKEIGGLLLYVLDLESLGKD